MKRGINGMAVIPTDLFTSIEVADSAGYDVLGLWAPRIEAFLNQGHTTDDLVSKFDSVSIRPGSIIAIENVDIPDGVERTESIAQCRRICEVAQAIGCPYIQMVAGSLYHRMAWPTIRSETARGLREMADVVGEYGLTVEFEPLAWMPVRSLEQAIEVVQEADRPNIAVIVDTFQAYAGGGELDTIRSLSPASISSAHLGDAAPRKLDVWSDDDRQLMPGDGIAPLSEIMGAILETGYDGTIVDEISPAAYRQWSRRQIAETLKAKGDAVLASL